MDYDRRGAVNVRINWDMDGVLAQFHEAVLAEYNRRYDDSLALDDFREYHIADSPLVRASDEEVWEMIAEVDYAEVRPYDMMVRIAKHWVSLGAPSAVISSLTWSPPNTHAMMKRDWIQRFLGEGFAIIFTHDKEWCCRSPRDILIDDKADNIAKWPGRGLLLERPWNRDERPDGMSTVATIDLHGRLQEMVR